VAENETADGPPPAIETARTRKPKVNPEQARATKMMTRKIAHDAQRKLTALEEENAKFVFFIKCPRMGWNEAEQTGHIAAWLTEKPSGAVIHPGMWESILHTAGEPWPHSYIPCQECFLERESQPWKAHMRGIARRDGAGFDFVFAADRQFVLGKIPRELYDLRQERIQESIAPIAKEK
jgi:hypothetical protein